MGRFHKEVILKGPKGEKKVNLLIDTGAVTSTIKKEIAEELGLPKTGEAKLYGLDRKPVKGDLTAINVIIDGCSTHIPIVFGDYNILGADAMQWMDANVEPKKHKITIRKCEPYQMPILMKIKWKKKQ